MSVNSVSLEDFARKLELEPAPRLVQLQPPAADRVSLALAVLGNVLVGAALLAGLLLAPSMLSVLLLPA